MSKGLITDSVAFSVSRYILVGLSLVRNFVVAHELGPSEYGVWIIVTLVTSYGDQIHLGLRHAGDKEIPYRRSSQGEKEALASANAIYGGILTLSVIATVALALYGLFASATSRLIRIGLIASSIIIFSDQVNRFYLMIFRSFKEFMLSSEVEVVVELARTILVSAFAIFFGFVGVVAASITISICMSGYLIRHYDGKFKPVIDSGRLKVLGKIGIPLFVSGLLYLLIISLDRVVGSIMLSSAGLGTYGVASLLAQIPVTFSQGVGAVLYPRLSERIGLSHSHFELADLFKPVMETIAIFVPIMVSVYAVIATFAIEWLLPAYQGAAGILLVLSVGVYFLCLAPIPMAVLMASGQQRAYIFAEVSGILASAPFYVILPHFAPMWISLAVSASVGFLVFASALLLSTYRLFGMDVRDSICRSVVYYIPTLLSIVLFALIWLVILDVGGFRSRSAVIRTVATLFFYLVGYLPLIAWWLRRSTVGKQLLSRLLSPHFL